MVVVPRNETAGTGGFLKRGCLIGSILVALLVGGCATQEDVHLAQSSASQAVTTANQALTTAHAADNTAQAALRLSGHGVHTECVRWSPSTGNCVRSAPRYTIARADVPTADWIASCARRYRSFDPASGTYLGYDGYRHYCH